MAHLVTIHTQGRPSWALVLEHPLSKPLSGSCLSSNHLPAPGQQGPVLGTRTVEWRARRKPEPAHLVHWARKYRALNLCCPKVQPKVRPGPSDGELFASLARFDPERVLYHGIVFFASSETATKPEIKNVLCCHVWTVSTTPSHPSHGFGLTLRLETSNAGFWHSGPYRAPGTFLCPGPRDPC